MIHTTTKHLRQSASTTWIISKTEIAVSWRKGENKRKWNLQRNDFNITHTNYPLPSSHARVSKCSRFILPYMISISRVMIFSQKIQSLGSFKQIKNISIFLMDNIQFVIPFERRVIVLLHFSISFYPRMSKQLLSPQFCAILWVHNYDLIIKQVYLQCWEYRGNIILYNT